MTIEIATPLNHRVGGILAKLREAGSDGTTFSALLRAIGFHQRFRFNNSEAISIGRTLHTLFLVELIRISSPGGIVEEGLSAAEGDIDVLSAFLRADQDSTIIQLTDRAATLQSLLGFSISALAAQSDGRPLFYVSPIFRRPSYGSAVQNDVVVLMPFNSRMRPVYDQAIRPACADAGLSCRRADDFFNSNEVMQDLWSSIFHARWIIADCTGRNANVFYELGIAHALGKSTILIAQGIDDIPFDLRHLRTFRYSAIFGGKRRLKAYLTAALSA